MLSSEFTDRLGVTQPLQQAPMGGVTTPELVAAVAAAGGVGMLPLQMLSTGVVRKMLDDIGARVEGAAGTFGVSFLMPWFDPALLDVVAGVPLVDFFYAWPDADLVKPLHEAGTFVSWQVGDADEARAAAAAGADFVIVQGVEAGGRLRGTTPLPRLLEAVLRTVEIPVVAAGGLGTAPAVAGALATGASAVRVGTRFLAAQEAATHPAYVDALVAASADDTTVTNMFSVMWPNGPEPHRVLRSAVEAASALGDGVAGTTMIGDTRLDLPRYAVACPNKSTTGAVEAMALYAGCGVDAVDGIVPAASIVEELAGGAETLLQRWA